jgi:hypothetical protein
VAQVEVFELRERRERVARQLGLVEAQLAERGEGGQAREHRILERNVGLHRLAEHELLELGRRREEAERIGDERHRLVVPKPAVDIELLEVGKRRESREFVFQPPRAHGDADEIQCADMEIAGGEIVEIADGRALSVEDHRAAEPQHALGDDPVVV